MSATHQTQQYSLKCRMTNEAAAIERLCQTIRVRGFRIRQMQLDASDTELNIALTLEGSRSVHMLTAQMAKLHTVISVDSQTAATGMSRTA